MGKQTTDIYVVLRGVTDAQVMQAKLAGVLPISRCLERDGAVLIELDGPDQWHYEADFTDYEGLNEEALFELAKDAGHTLKDFDYFSSQWDGYAWIAYAPGFHGCDGGGNGQDLFKHFNFKSERVTTYS